MRVVLVVDDDELHLRACVRLLGQNVDLLIAQSLDQARELLRTTPRIDAAVIDYVLGNHSGLDLLLEIRAAHPQCRTLMLSGHASVEVAVLAMRAGADEVRQKPVHPRAWLRWIELGTWEADEDPVSTATAERVLWEYSRRVVSDCGGNHSEAARRLGIERATLRRQLRKRAPRR